MKKFSKLMAVLLALVMCLSLLPMAAFAEEAKNPNEAPFGDPYDEVITDAGKVEKTDVPNAVENANEAIKGIDTETNGKISDAQQAVAENEAVVNAANDAVTEAVNTANSAQQTVESAQQTVANAGTLAEREAALEIANAAVETAEKAVTEAQNALTTANEAYTKAEQAVADAQAALDKITKEHNAAVGEAEGDLAAAKADAQRVLNEAKAKLDKAGTTRDELSQKAQDAQKALDKAAGLVTTAEGLLEKAKNNAAGLKVDEVLEDKEKQENLTNQTQDVKDKKEALDALGTTDEAEQDVTNAKTALDNFDKTGLEGKDKAACETEKSETESSLETLQGQTKGLEEAAATANRNVSMQEDVIKGLNVEILAWEQNGRKQIPSISGDVGNVANGTLKDAVDQWDNNSTLTGIAQYWFNKYFAQNGKSKEDMISELRGLIQDMPDAYDKLPEEQAKLGELQNIANQKQTAVTENQTAITNAQNKLAELEETISKLNELEGLQNALDEALETLNGLKKQIEDAKDAYGQAVADLSKTLKGAGTAYDATTDYDKLMDDAAKLQNAIDKLNELNAAIADKELKDAAQKEAQYNYDHAMAGLNEAEKALAKAQQAVNDAKANASAADLTALNANLEKAKADFEAAKKAAEDAQANKDKADQAKKDADDNAANAAQRVQDAINNLNGGTGTTTIDDVAVPLAAGPVTRAEFIDYLWRHEGSPAAEGELFADHEYAPAIAWALSVGLIDEAFEPDELVTVADVRAILGNFADVFGTNAVAAADLTTLVGEDDEAVLNCDEVLAEFFGEEYVTAEDEAA